MLWTSTQRTTRSGTIFAAWTSAIDYFAPLLLQAVAAECDDQEDKEPEDDDDVDQDWTPEPLNQVDDNGRRLIHSAVLTWSSDPLNTVDDVPAAPSRKRCASPTFEQVVASGPAQSGSHRRRALKRARGVETHGHVARPAAIRKYVGPAQPLHLPAFDAAALPTAHGAYAAKVEDRAEKRGGKQRRSLAELIGVGFQLIPWNGFDPQPLVDSEGRVFLVLVGQPRDERYRASVGRAYDFIKQQGAAAPLSCCLLQAPTRPLCRHQRRADVWQGTDASHLAGQQGLHEPHGAAPLPTTTSPAWLTLLAVSSIPSSMWAPRLYQYYVDYNTRLRLRFPDLKPPVPQIGLLMRGLHFGNVCCFKHRDVCNLPFGWCAVQSLGNFDPHLGGHLVLWDLKLVVEFPAGALILLPSATIAHSNVPVQDGDERVSFTQFTAGGLFRYTDHGFRTQAELAAEDPVEYERVMEQRERRWKKGLGLFSTVEDLVANLETVEDLVANLE
ncbi:hypothetical protein B0H14DRAFT_3500617 [Mycena olivaceomarginata]|nr:hypothetical protein B0H14DRAFT_3500617 [Mycena olivaceomarginata]